MGRQFAGTLGFLALGTVVARGILHGADVQSALTAGSLCLIVFAAIGYVAGQLAQWIVDESVRAKFAAQIETGETKETANGTPNATP